MAGQSVQDGINQSSTKPYHKLSELLKERGEVTLAFCGMDQTVGKDKGVLDRLAQLEKQKQKAWAS